MELTASPMFTRGKGRGRRWGLTMVNAKISPALSAAAFAWELAHRLWRFGFRNDEIVHGAALFIEGELIIFSASSTRLFTLRRFEHLAARSC